MHTLANPRDSIPNLKISNGNTLSKNEEKDLKRIYLDLVELGFTSAF